MQSALSKLSGWDEALRRRVRRLVEHHPSAAWTAALLFVFGGSACIAGALFPLSPTEDKQLVAAVGVSAYAIALPVWVWGRRLPQWAFPVLMTIGTALISIVVATGTNNGGVMTAAFTYSWIAIYAAHFFPRPLVYLQATLITSGFGSGLIAADLPNMLIRWIIVSFTVWSTCLVLSHLSEALRHQADTDQLTGLLNRNGFAAAAMRYRAIAQRSGAPITLALLDLNNFKQINDGHGHAVGDRLLAELGRAWRERLRAGDILGRHGGDEFVLLLPATTPEEAQEVLRRLRVEGLEVSWSVGLEQWQAGETLEECIARADGRLYEVKHSHPQNPGHKRASLAPFPS